MNRRGACIAASAGAFVLLSVAHAIAHPAVGIVVDRRGNVFYTDLAQVWRIAPNGTRTVAVPNVHTHELSLDAAGTLHGEHLWFDGGTRWRHYTWKLSASGVLEKSPTREGFLQDASFVRDPAGNMYWFNPGPPAGFMRRAPGGAVTQLGAGSSYREVRWLAVSAKGEIYFIDGGDLRRMASSGVVETVAFRIRERAEGWVGGLFVAPEGEVYVAVWSERVVRRFNPATKHVDVVSRSTAPWAPSGVTIAPNGDLWLVETSDSNAVRVRHIPRTGAERVFGG